MDDYPIFGMVNPVPPVAPSAAQQAARDYASQAPRAPALAPDQIPAGEYPSNYTTRGVVGSAQALGTFMGGRAPTFPDSVPAAGPVGKDADPSMGPPDRQTAQEQLETARWNAHVAAVKTSPQGYALSGAGIPDAQLLAKTPADWTKQAGVDAMAGKGLAKGQFRELNVGQEDGSRIFGSAVNGGKGGAGGLNNFVGVGGAGPGGAGAGGKKDPLESAIADLHAISSGPMNTREKREMRQGLMAHIIGLMGAQHNQGVLNLETQKAIPGIQMANQVAGKIGSDPEAAARLVAAGKGESGVKMLQTATGYMTAPAFGGVPGTSYGFAGAPAMTVTPPPKIKLSRDDERR